MRDKILSAISEALSTKEGDEHYVHNAVMPEIEGLLVDCPECCTVRYDDDQYHCNTCEGRGYIRALEWVKEQAADAVMEVVRQEIFDFAIWSSEDVTPVPFMPDPRNELMIDVGDSVEVRTSKIERLYALYLESLTARKG